MSTGGHFKGYFKAKGSWWTYDGLYTPEMSEVYEKQLGGLIEHVILFRN